MISRWLKTRSVRKFLRSRSAVTALVIVLLYALVGFSVGVFGLITLDDTEDRVGAQNVPGFFLQQEPEKRLEDSEILLESVERALKKAKPQAALSEMRFGRRQVAELPPPQLQQLVDQGWRIYDELAASEDLNQDASLRARLADLEQVCDQLLPYPSGRDGYVQSLLLSLGTDRQGRSILLRAVYSIKVAILIGVVTALVSVVIGSLLGSAAAFFGGWVDHIVIWLYTTFSSIPNLVLLVLLAYMFTGSVVENTLPLFPVYVAFCATFWIGPCRVIRGEALKIKELEYVQAATTIGFGRGYILLRHILPNVSHLMLVNFSLLFIGAIKSEVILSFLGLGVKRGPSWGIMISQSAPEVVTGFFWQIGATTAFMFVLVLAFNVLSDTLQDVLDPKHL